MENTCCLLCMLILLLFRITEGTPLGATAKAKTDHTVKVNQEVAPSWEKGVLLETKNISALLGEEATLVVNTITEMQDIQWVKNGINFATTKPNKGVTIRESSYNGRLVGSNDGSLIIQSLTMEDQGEYKADIFTSDLKNYEIIYYLHISEERDSHAVAAVVSMIVVLLLVAGAVAAFIMWKQKRCFQKTREFPVIKARSDPEGTSEQEKELNPKGSSPSSPEGTCEQEKERQPKDSSQSSPDSRYKTNDDEENEDETFEDAKEFPEEEVNSGDTPSIYMDSPKPMHPRLGSAGVFSGESP